MANSERDDRKRNNVARREVLGDRINEYNAELDRLVGEFDAICDEEELEAKDEGYVPLFDVCQHTWVSLSHDPKSLFFFDHIDGMYSYCLTIEGKLVHIGASTLVIEHDLNLECPEKAEVV